MSYRDHIFITKDGKFQVLFQIQDGIEYSKVCDTEQEAREEWALDMKAYNGYVPTKEQMDKLPFIDPNKTVKKTKKKKHKDIISHDYILITEKKKYVAFLQIEDYVEHSHDCDTEEDAREAWAHLVRVFSGYEPTKEEVSKVPVYEMMAVTNYEMVRVK